MAVLVLGGAGYIGSHTVYELEDAGEDVVIVDNLATGHREAVQSEGARFMRETCATGPSWTVYSNRRKLTR